MIKIIITLFAAFLCWDFVKALEKDKIFPACQKAAMLITFVKIVEWASNF